MPRGEPPPAEIAATDATVKWTLANHDVHRAVTRFGLVPSIRPAPPIRSATSPGLAETWTSPAGCAGPARH